LPIWISEHIDRAFGSIGPIVNVRGSFGRSDRLEARRVNQTRGVRQDELVQIRPIHIFPLRRVLLHPNAEGGIQVAVPEVDQPCQRIKPAALNELKVTRTLIEDFACRPAFHRLVIEVKVRVTFSSFASLLVHFLLVHFHSQPTYDPNY